MSYQRWLIRVLPYIICLLFFVAYSTLSIVRHNHYGSFGYDLGINDQTVWLYSHFRLPLTTIDPFSDKTKLAEHVESIYAIIAPAYWIWSSPIILLVLQSMIFCISAVAVYLLARKHKLSNFSSNTIMLGYLMFYGTQFGLWTDVHSSVFATAFVMWFIYFLDQRRHKLTIIFFILALTAKESVGTSLFFTSFIYFWYRKEKIILLYLGISVIYVLFIFFVFFPLIMHTSYLYANRDGLLSNSNPFSLIDSEEKRLAIFYSFASWGFIPFLSSIALLPVLSHFYKFFVFASDLPGVHGIFGHYRIGITPFLALATIWTFKRFNSRLQTIAGIWLLLSIFYSQYFLHLPLSYLTKQWFWKEPSAVKNINAVIHESLPPTASVVSQNNITPHISQRDKIFTLYPDKKVFQKHSPCKNMLCNWFRWEDSPEFLIVDTSPEWDIRHLLTDRPLFLDGLSNLEKTGIIQKYKQIGNTVLYKIIRNPDKLNL